MWPHIHFRAKTSRKSTISMWKALKITTFDNHYQVKPRIVAFELLWPQFILRNTFITSHYTHNIKKLKPKFHEYFYKIHTLAFSNLLQKITIINPLSWLYNLTNGSWSLMKDCRALQLPHCPRSFWIRVPNLLLFSTNDVPCPRHCPKGFRNKKKTLTKILTSEALSLVKE